MKRLINILTFIIPPLGVMAIVLAVFAGAGFYPFGSGSVSWCDMNQQTVPLLIDLKDILDGKSGMFLNMNNAAGMNFYGVFFFFLASPFSLLVKLVDKADMISFVNILVMLKLMTAALTAQIYFRSCQKSLSRPLCVILSMMYALCGYGMLFYQNVIWLDMMYLFPLLMLSLEQLVKKQNNILYTVMITVMLIVNYYISYMTVLFILLFMAVYVSRHFKDENTGRICVKFISGSVIGALLSAVVWLPCFIQFLSSGRGESTVETIANADLISSYKTVLPLLFCSAFIFAAVGINVFSGKKRTERTKTYLILFALTLVPFFIEPVNIMWHTGNYMSFPARYGFITIFMGLICCAEFLSQEEHESKPSLPKMITACAAVFAATALYVIFLLKNLTLHFEELTNYTKTLWGNDRSFEGLAALFIAALLCYGAAYFVYRRGFIVRSLFTGFVCLIFIIESAANVKLYMTSAHLRNPWRNQSSAEICAIADKIGDDSFYRVATDEKITDYNMIGALGYPSLSHYTSLTDKDYMFTQKRLGYTSVWMEVGSGGGTELTNALYAVKYKILRNTASDDAVYSKNGYSIVKTPYSFGLGLVTDADLSGCREIPAGLTRAQVQDLLYSSLFGSDSKLITEYPYSEEQSYGIKYENSKYQIGKNASITFNIDVKGRQSLYADCFDRLSNDLQEVYFDSLDITVNGAKVTSDYPRTTENGVLKLGEFENSHVTVRISCEKSVSCYSFGVFGLDLDVLESAVESSQSANISYSDGKLIGSCESAKPQKCLLTVPYGDGFTIKVNGKKVSYDKVFSDFILFELPQGKCDIEITYAPKGFYAGLVISIIGASAFALYVIFRRKLSIPKKLERLTKFVTLTATLAAAAAVYILPLVISFVSVIK